MEASAIRDTGAPGGQLADDLTGGILWGLATCTAPTRIPVADLLPADSPRLDGERVDHVRVLAEAHAELPPILVHRSTMRVIDGMHRLRAAKLRGDRTVEVQFCDCDDDLAFVAAVRSNVAHGLPLSLADREAAAVRILASHGHWSNRTIAAVTGLAPSTVGAIRRRRPGDGDGDQGPRLGRDGRVRPVSAAAGRRLAAEFLARRPDASLREVARAASVSTGTVRDVRRRIADGRDPVPSRVRAERRTVRVDPPPRDRDTILRNLREDPSLRFTESGRELLRWLDARSRGPEQLFESLAGLPAHCRYPVAELADWCAERWLELARRLRQADSE